MSEVELGRGSGAVVRRGKWGARDVAVKIWSEEKFSDGDARGEAPPSLRLERALAAVALGERQAQRPRQRPEPSD